MGCTASLPEGSSSLRREKPWSIEYPSGSKGLNENDLQQMRKEFWDNRVEGDLDKWASLKQVCELMLQNKYAEANSLFDELSLQIPNGDLSLCIDTSDFKYRIEKYCYSTPSNLLEAKYERQSEVKTNEEHEFKVRVQCARMDEEMPISIRLIPKDSVEKMKTVIKEQIHDKIKQDFTLEQLRLIYMGQEMKVTKELKDYKIEPDSVIMGFLQI
ncbi:hypothetical protein WA158_000054 [Blastocystis sp. Blastoise]